MPRRLTVDRRAAPAKAPDARSLQMLWRHFVGAKLDRQPSRRLSSHLLRDIGLSGQSTSDGEEPWKRLK